MKYICIIPIGHTKTGTVVEEYVYRRFPVEIQRKNFVPHVEDVTPEKVESVITTVVEPLPDIEIVTEEPHTQSESIVPVVIEPENPEVEVEDDTWNPEYDVKKPRRKRG